MPPNLEYEIRPHDGGVKVLSMVGEVDIAAVSGLKGVVEDLIRGGAHDLVYDLSEVEAIDSTGLGFLVWSRKRLREQPSGRLRLVVSRPQVQRVLRLTGLVRLFEVYADLATAMDRPAPEEEASGEPFRPDPNGAATGRP